MGNLTKEQIQDQIREEAKKALATGEVSCVVGWTKTRFPDKTKPFFAYTDTECDLLVWNEYCINSKICFR